MKTVKKILKKVPAGKKPAVKKRSNDPNQTMFNPTKKHLKR